jgi:circadian clock protein KaiC
VLSTGVSGLDEVLAGGLPADHICLVDGDPGTGKTTLALQFLREAVARGERALYVALSESGAELRAIAQSHGWTTEGIDIFELADTGGGARGESDYTLFHPSEIELQDTIDRLFTATTEHNPQRVVLDSLSEMRLLARDPLRFRRQLLSLKHFFDERACTVLMLDDRTAPFQDKQLHSLAHGVIELEHVALEYGAERRRLQVRKLRGKRFHGGYHDFRILTGGLRIFPRLETGKPLDRLEEDNLESGSPELDALLGGGIQRGTSVLISGAAGTGKSVLSSQFASAAIQRGENVQFYLFDERLATFNRRASALGMRFAGGGKLHARQVEPTEMSPGEFATDVMRCVEDHDASFVIIDSISGYMQSMPEERLLAVQVHEMLTYLANRGVTTIMTLVQHGLFGGTVDPDADVSYLADTVMLLRYFEVRGAVRQAISVVKKRSGDHERSIRECRVGPGGLRVGEPLREFQGVLTGVPQYVGGTTPLLSTKTPMRPARPTRRKK